MNGHLASQRIILEAHQARIAETAPPARTRTAADQRWRRAAAASGAVVARLARAVRRTLTLPEPGPVEGAQPALLGRHAKPGTPPC